MIDAAPDTAALRAHVTALAWERGLLRWLLAEHQKPVYDALASTPADLYFLRCARRVGKSYTLLVRAVEKCLKGKPDGGPVHIVYLGPEQKQVRKIVSEHFGKIFKTAPAKYKPRWVNLDSQYVFDHNGSRLSLAGCDSGHAESLRGQEADEVLFDEVGFVGDAVYITDSILQPMLQHTEGKIVFATTPAKTPGHPSAELYRRCVNLNAFARLTFWDNTLFSPEKKQAMFLKKAKERGLTPEQFREDPAYLREWMAEDVVDSNYAVIPEWTLRGKELIRPLSPPAHKECYVGVDLGYNDGSGALFAYIDYANQKLCVQAELLVRRQTTLEFVHQARMKEAQLWGKRAPAMRVGDGGGQGKQLLEDMNRTHGYTIIPAMKAENKEVTVMALRRLVAQGLVWVDPSCVILLDQLKNTVWNEQRKSYERTENGHGELLDALVYLCCNLDWAKNPVPVETPDEASHYVRQPAEKPMTTMAAAQIAQTLGMRKIRRKFGF